jgi:hypothetical protein
LRTNLNGERPGDPGLFDLMADSVISRSFPLAAVWIGLGHRKNRIHPASQELTETLNFCRKIWYKDAS